ncbi:pseudouridine synthase [Agaribacterium sp. ZY112]|uniref:pseudouridine synthase n=1 Tax=Agaribacterium sp. ZY112 TaxID=3233574 RepID=UPI003526C230
MKSKHSRLDRFINKHSHFSLSDTRLLIAQGRILVDSQPAHSIRQRIGEFSTVVLDGLYLQDRQPVYLMFNKPKGCVCATKDNKHKTVLDFLEHPQKQELHIVGRLDFNSTGLVLLTNDGAWSRKLSLPETKLNKIYRVVLAKAITEAELASYQKAFSEGMYFGYEGVQTKPAVLELINPNTALVTLVEGKYHQVKRMFGRFDNEVLELHRLSVGHIALDEDLQEGDARELSKTESALDSRVRRS